MDVYFLPSLWLKMSKIESPIIRNIERTEDKCTIVHKCTSEESTVTQRGEEEKKKKKKKRRKKRKEEKKEKKKNWKNCKEKKWEAGNLKELKLGSLFARQCNAADEIREMLKSNFGTIFGFSAFHYLSLHQNFWWADDVKEDAPPCPRIEKISSISEPLQGHPRASCFDCWVPCQCSNSRGAAKGAARGSAWLICDTHPLSRVVYNKYKNVRI